MLPLEGECWKIFRHNYRDFSLKTEEITCACGGADI
jgi:hypothetical protein